MASQLGSETKDATEAKERVKEIVKLGVDIDKVHKFYEEWASSYNTDLAKIAYHPPVRAAEEVALYFSYNKDIRILDVAAGTGMGGVELQKRGFKNIDALDGSQAMLDAAKRTGAYNNLYCTFFGPNKTEIPDGCYDVVVTTGSFVPSHLDERSYEEFIRVTKPGGYIIIVMYEQYFKTDPSYTGAIEKRMDELCQQGVWTKIDRKVVKDYFDGGNGIAYILKKKRLDSGIAEIYHLSNNLGSESKNAKEAEERRTIILRNGVDSKDILEYYENWASSYDQDLAKVDYNAPIRGAEQVAMLFNHDKNIHILDVAAGTGLVGVELQKCGFKNVDAIDASQAMLDIAQKTGAYNRLYCAFIGPNATEVPAETYDVLIITGTFAPSHLDENCYEELIRLTKPGGYIINVMNEIYFKTEPQYTDALEKRMDELCEHGMWTKVAKKVIPNYCRGNGIAFIMRK